MSGKPLAQYQEWTREDLDDFLGSPRARETTTKETKGGRAFQQDDLPDKFKDTLGKVISAFANTEGGWLFLGVEEIEEAGQKKYCVDPGIPKKWDFSRVVDILTGCTHPPFLDLRVKEIPWDEQHNVFIVHVPEFRVNPVQGRDFRYYRRIEDKSKPIPEDLVRALYNKNRSPDVHLEIEAHLGGKEGSKGKLHFYNYGLKIILYNKSHVRSQDVRVEIEIENCRTSSNYDRLLPSYKLDITPEMVGILFGDNKREMWIKHRSFSSLIARYYENISQPDIHRLVTQDDPVLKYKLFADDSKPKEGAFRINQHLPAEKSLL